MPTNEAQLKWIADRQTEVARVRRAADELHGLLRRVLAVVDPDDALTADADFDAIRLKARVPWNTLRAELLAAAAALPTL